MTLGNERRMRILQLLADDGPKSVSMVASELQLEQSAVSHNLKHLLVCHFVTVRQDGKERVYAINEDTIKPLLKQIERHVSKYCVKNCDHQNSKIKEN